MSRSDGRRARSPSSGLGVLLRARRESLGLSQEELSRASGIGLATIHAVEIGRAPRRSTLARYLRTLPGLCAEELLQWETGECPAASPAAWAHARDAWGFWARRVRRTLTRRSDGTQTVELEVSGVRTTRADLEDPVVLSALLRSACVGRRDLLRRLDLFEAQVDGRRLELEDESGWHSFFLPKRLRSAGFTYRHRRDEPIPTETDPEATHGAGRLQLDGTSWLVDYPAERLELVVRFADSRRRREARCFAWPAPVPPDPFEGDQAARLHPRGVDLAVGPGRLTLGIARPLPGLRYGLGWARARPATGTPPLTLGAGARRDRGVADVLREVREDNGLSLRECSELVGVSWVAVRNAEHGVDLRSRTLRAYLAAFSELAPQDLLPEEPPEVPLDDESAWSYQCRLYGFVADEVRKTLKIFEDGTCETVLETRGLRSLRPEGGDLRLRMGLTRAVLEDAPAVMERIAARVEGMRTRVVDRSDGRTVHQLTFPRNLLENGISYRRRIARRPVYRMTARRSREHRGTGGPFYEGCSSGASLPCRSLSLKITFPADYAPEEVASHVWATVVVPDAELPPISALPPPLVRLRTSNRALLASFRVPRPLVGMKYALGWRLP